MRIVNALGGTRSTRVMRAMQRHCGKLRAYSMTARVTVTVLSAVLGAGCAQTVVRPELETLSTNLPRPSRVLVYDFAVTPADVHPDQNVLKDVATAATGTTPAERETALGQKVAASVSQELVTRVRAMGLPAERATTDTPVDQNDVKILGAFVDVDQGNQLRRLVIGLGAGEAKVDTEIEVLQVSDTGNRSLAQFTTHADSGEMPGAALTMGAGAAATGGLSAGMAVANAAVSGVKIYRSAAEQMAARSAEKAAAYLSKVFARQGWVAPSR